MGQYLCPPRPSVALAVNITVSIPSLGYAGAVSVLDIWAGAVVDQTNDTFTAPVPHHGTGFYRMSAVSES